MAQNPTPAPAGKPAPAAKPNPAVVAGAAVAAAAPAAATKPAKEKTEIETVKMTDGRLVDFPGKRRLQKESFISNDGVVSIRLDFRNGETRTWRIPDKLKNQCAAHGGEQKLGDEIAGVEDIDDAVEAIDELIMRLDSGEWTQRREGGSGAAGSSILLQAIVAVTGKSQEAVRGFLKDLDPKAKVALREAPEFSAKVRELEAAKRAAKKPVDISDALAKLKTL